MPGYSSQESMTATCFRAAADQNSHWTTSVAVQSEYKQNTSVKYRKQNIHVLNFKEYRSDIQKLRLPLTYRKSCRSNNFEHNLLKEPIGRWRKGERNQYLTYRKYCCSNSFEQNLLKQPIGGWGKEERIQELTNRKPCSNSFEQTLLITTASWEAEEGGEEPMKSLGRRQHLKGSTRVHSGF